MKSKIINLLLSVSESFSESTSAEGVGENGFRLAIQYGWYILLIVAGLLLLAFVKRKSKKNLTPSAVKQSCLLLKKKLEAVLCEKDKNRNGLFNQAKVAKLRSLAEEAMWNALRLVDERKDMAFEGVASGLDGIANLLSELSDDAFADAEETERYVREALERTQKIIGQIDDIVSARKG